MNTLKRKSKLESENPEPDKKLSEEYDMFSRRFNFSLESHMLEMLRSSKKCRSIVKRDIPEFGPIVEYRGTDNEPSLDVLINGRSFGWNASLAKNFEELTDSSLSKGSEFLLNAISRYIDICAYVNGEDHRTIYMAHMLHHLIQTRNLIITNKHKIQVTQDTVDEELTESCRDQGFVRPTVLILCPFKKDAYDLVGKLKALVFGPGQKGDVRSGDRFEKEYASDDAEVAVKNEELKKLFSGNTDDCFRLGIALSKKTLKLYEAFDNADILLCSPLGLRMILDGDEGTEGHLVSNIQICIVDGADIMLQQNWEHISLIFSMLNCQPVKINTDIARVRHLYLEGNGKFFSQLMLFSKYPHELFTALMMEHSFNFRGLILSQPKQEGTLDLIEVPLCQELHRFDVSDPAEQSEARFKYFRENISTCLLPHTCIVVPSYYDFVRLRNHFKRSDESYVSCHEYAKQNKIDRARDMFYHHRKNVMLVTERYHFFNRKRVRGIHQIIFYQLPSHPTFYAEMINWAEHTNGLRFKSILLYSKFDRTRLQNAFGSEMTSGILGSSKQLQVIASE